MSKRKSTSVVLKTPQNSSNKPSKRKIPFKTHLLNEETQYLTTKSQDLNESNDEKTIAFNINSSLLTEYKEENNKITKTRDKLQQNLINNIMNSVSLRFHYEEILESEIDFLLPRKYKLLLNKFNALNKAIHLKNLQNKQAFYQEIQYELQIEGIFISFNDLEQIFYINEEFFDLSRNSKGLIIEIKNCEENKDSFEKFSNERSRSFRHYLVSILKSFHFNFLKSIGKERDYVLYESQKVWHHEFQLEKMPDIPTKDLKEFFKKPEKQPSKHTKKKKFSKEKIKRENEKIEEANSIEQKILLTVFFFLRKLKKIFFFCFQKTKNKIFFFI